MARPQEKAEILDEIFDLLYIKTVDDLKILLAGFKDEKRRRNRAKKGQ